MIFGQVVTSPIDEACAGADIVGTLDDMGSLVNAGMMLASAITQYGSDIARELAHTYGRDLTYEWQPYQSLDPRLSAADSMSNQAVGNICHYLTSIYTASKGEMDPDVAEARLYLEKISQEILTAYIPESGYSTPLPDQAAAPRVKKVQWKAIAIGSVLFLSAGLIGWLSSKNESYERTRATRNRRYGHRYDRQARQGW